MSDDGPQVIETVTKPPSLALLYPKALLPTQLRGSTLPDKALELPEVRIDRRQLGAYNEVCGYRQGGPVPSTFPHVLAFPLAMQLMTDRAFPLQLLGLVHVRNVITQHRPLDADEPLRLRVHAERLDKGERGTSVDLVGVAWTADDEEVWTDRSTYLQRSLGGGSGKSRDGEQPTSSPDSIWSVPGDIGRRYAAVSGDRNPIHLHPLSARLFGFPRAIAHGMWSKARCLAALDARLPEAYQVDVSFRAPVLLPGKVGFSAQRDGDGWSLRLTDPKGQREHLRGTVHPAAD